MIEQSAVGSDQIERAVVGEPQVVETAGGAVQDAQSHNAGSDVEVGIGDAVGDDRVAEQADVGRVGLVETAVRGESSILDDQWNIVHSIGFRKVQRIGVGVVDQEQSGESALYVPLGGSMRMWVIPERRRRLVDGPRRFPPPAGFDGLVRSAVEPGGRCMPCQWTCRGLCQCVSIVNATDSPRRALTVGPRIEPLKPQVSVIFPATISVVPAPARRVKWRTPESSTVDAASGGIGNGREDPAAAVGREAPAESAESAPQPTAKSEGRGARPNSIERREIRFIILLK